MEKITKNITNLDHIDKTNELIDSANSQDAALAKKLEAAALEPYAKKESYAVYTAKSAYDASSCKEYCERKSTVSWGDGEIVEKKDPNMWKIGNIITLLIPCTDGTVYVSKQKVQGASSLLPMSYAIINEFAPKSHTHTASQVSGLATVATTGSYNNLSNKPTIPSNTNQLTNGAGFITASASITGNSATTTKLAKAVNINGVSFDGSSSITIKADPNAHIHAIENITGLQSALNGKQPSGNYALADNVYDKDTIDGKLTSAMHYKGSKATYSALPAASLNTIGDMWNVTADGHNYAWNGTSWDKMAGTIDLSAYAKTETVNAGLAKKQDTLSAAQLSAANSGITSTKVSTYDGYASQISGKANAVHSHQIEDIGGLSDTLSELQPILDPQQIEAVNSGITSDDILVFNEAAAAIPGINESLNSKAERIHTHEQSDITGLTNALANKLGKKQKAESAKDADTVNGLTVQTAVPLNAVFTDTTYGIATTVKSGLMSSADRQTISELKAVATSGSYTDLSDKPTIPTDTNQLTNGAGFITENDDILGKAQFADIILDGSDPSLQTRLYSQMAAIGTNYVNDPIYGCATWDLEDVSNPKLRRIQWKNVAALISKAYDSTSSAHIMRKDEVEALLKNAGGNSVEKTIINENSWTDNGDGTFSYALTGKMAVYGVYRKTLTGYIDANCGIEIEGDTPTLTSIDKFEGYALCDIKHDTKTTSADKAIADQNGNIFEQHYVTKADLHNRNYLPVGFEYFTLNKNIRAGSIPYLGGEYDRETYKDLWEYVQAQEGYLILESEWQRLFTENNGNVPFYSRGNGSTTFRVPSVKCWVKGANGIQEVGSYLEAGLPNIKGEISNTTTNGSIQMATPTTINGPFRGIKRGNAGWSGSIDGCYDLYFDASKADPIYGTSTTVQPASIVGVYCVVAFGTVTNVGETDVSNFVGQFTNIKSQIDNLNLDIKKIKDKEAKEDEVFEGEGYIKLANGFKFAWGTAVNGTFNYPIPFTNVVYTHALLVSSSTKDYYGYPTEYTTTYAKYRYGNAVSMRAIVIGY